MLHWEDDEREESFEEICAKDCVELVPLLVGGFGRDTLWISGGKDDRDWRDWDRWEINYNRNDNQNSKRGGI